MNVKELKAFIADLPDDMPVASLCMDERAYSDAIPEVKDMYVSSYHEGNEFIDPAGWDNSHYNLPKVPVLKV